MFVLFHFVYKKQILGETQKYGTDFLCILHIPTDSHWAGSLQLPSRQRSRDQEDYMQQFQCQALCE